MTEAAELLRYDAHTIEVGLVVRVSGSWWRKAESGKFQSVTSPRTISEHQVHTAGYRFPTLHELLNLRDLGRV